MSAQLGHATTATARTLMIMAGGTGGHIFPALAVAEYVRGCHWKVVWLGARSGMEAVLVPQRGFDMAWVRFSGVRGKGARRLVSLPFEMLVALWQSARAIFRYRPDVVLGMGGYIAFPGGVMAALLRKPLVIHEQNSVAGLANRLLAACANRVLTAFPDPFVAQGSRRRHAAGMSFIPRPVAVEMVGNPIRAEIAALPEPQVRYAARHERLRLLVVGGSLGAQALNDAVPRALAVLHESERPVVTHQAGAGHIETLRRNYLHAGVAADLVPFIDDMAARYAEADLVLCRAGATTIAELAAAGVASVLVPFPHAVDDHQTCNARFLSERGAAIQIAQRELTPERLAALLRELTRERLATMAACARKLAQPEATRRVAEICMGLAA